MSDNDPSYASEQVVWDRFQWLSVKYAGRDLHHRKAFRLRGRKKSSSAMSVQRQRDVHSKRPPEGGLSVALTLVARDQATAA